MYSHVFVGGTFDRLHKGHETILERAFSEGDRVTIGLTSDEFVAAYRANMNISTFAQRKSLLLTWLSARGLENRASVISINDPYEPAASMGDIDALVVTKDNRIRGEEINKRRVSKGLSSVDLIEVLLVGAQDQAPISATRIRNGEIDASGRLVMPDNLRPELGKPLGDVLVGDNIGSSFESHRSGVIIAVGDITCKTLLTAGIVPRRSIVDGKVGRQEYLVTISRLEELHIPITRIASGPGYISREALSLLQSVPQKPEVILVSGEEDLLTLPAVVYAPLGAVVYYGQPDKGLVEVVVTDEKITLAKTLLAKFQEQTISI